MNKTQIVRMLAERLDITLVDSRIYLNTLLDIVVEGVITDEKVGIHEFGKHIYFTSVTTTSPESENGRESDAYSP